MNQLGFYRPTSLEDAAAFLAANPGSRILCGGSDLIVKWKNGMLPELTHLVDIGVLPVANIRVNAGKVSIGAACTMFTIVHHPEVIKRFPALVQAADMVGALQIRTMASLAGNVANASPAGDTIPALMSLDASVLIRGVEGTRLVPIIEFFKGPGKTVLEAGEFIEAFELPDRITRGSFLKLGERRAHAISKVSAAVSVWVGNGGRQIWQIALGAVAPTVIRIKRAEALLDACDGRLSPELIEKVQNVVRQDVSPISDLRSEGSYRRKMAGTLVSRAIQAIQG